MLRILEDIRNAQRNDPAARGILEIVLCYPGLHAIWFHRIARGLWRLGLPVLPRLVSHVARFLTGIEIHPGATFGRRVFIDHGMGTVIGETTVVGDDCLIYQGVTLGGTSLTRGKRHPTLEEHVVVGSGAKILGNITIGHHSRVGSGSVVIKSSPPHSTIVGIPGRIIEEKKDTEVAGHELDHNHLPDLTAKAIASLHDQVQELAREIADLRHRPVVAAPPPPGLTPDEVEGAFRALDRSAKDASDRADPLNDGAGI